MNNYYEVILIIGAITGYIIQPTGFGILNGLIWGLAIIGFNALIMHILTVFFGYTKKPEINDLEPDDYRGA